MQRNNKFFDMRKWNNSKNTLQKKKFYVMLKKESALAMDYEFDKEFENDEELEEEFVALMDSILEGVEPNETSVTVLNPRRLEQMKFAYAVLRYITKGTSMKVSYKLRDPFPTMGYISVEGRELSFSNAEWFSRVAEFASNTEVYALDKNAVRLTFTFHGLTIPVM